MTTQERAHDFSDFVYASLNESGQDITIQEALNGGYAAGYSDAITEVTKLFTEEWLSDMRKILTSSIHPDTEIIHCLQEDFKDALSNTKKK